MALLAGTGKLDVRDLGKTLLAETGKPDLQEHVLDWSERRSAACMGEPRTACGLEAVGVLESAVELISRGRRA